MKLYADYSRRRRSRRRTLRPLRSACAGMMKGGWGDERGREACVDQEKFLKIPILFHNGLDPGESVLHFPRGKRRPGPLLSDPKKVPAKPTGDVRLAPASRAGAIRRANRAGANGRARRRAIRAKKGGWPPPRFRSKGDPMTATDPRSEPRRCWRRGWPEEADWRRAMPGRTMRHAPSACRT